MLNLSTQSADRWFEAADEAFRAGQLGQSLLLYEKALTANPAHSRALAGTTAAGIRGSAEQLAAATTLLQSIAARFPSTEAHRQAGICCYRGGRLGEALRHFQQARALGGGEDSALLDLVGIVHMRRGDAGAAVDCFQRAIAIRPDAALYTNLGAALLDAGRLPEAEAACAKAIEMHPSDMMARHNYAKVLIKRDRFAAAAGQLDIALTQQPQDADLWCTLGIARAAGGDARCAMAALRRSLEIKPSPRAESQLLFVMHEAERPPQEILAQARQWDGIYGPAPAQPHVVDHRPDRPLRIGYLSGDFYRHPVATFIAPLLRSHHRDAVEVFCYSHVARPDAMTDWLKSLTPGWRDIARLDDGAAASLIAGDRIDILVDLEGHCSGNRLGIAARRPAPVQITYLGYPGTTGLTAISYRLTSTLLDPPGETEAFCSEKLLRLDGPFAVYGIPDTAPPVSPLPMESAGCCRFASFASRGKVSDAVLHVWGRILGQLPGSRLDLYTFDQSELPRLAGFFGIHGVSADRISLHGRLELQHYFAAHRDVDILLDAFPLSGHTVVCHGLWMGVPSICMRGRIYWERLGSATMEWAGLKEFIAATPEEYVSIAVRMARNPAQLASLRRTMRDRLQASPLLDCQRHAREVEAAYRTAWTQTVL
jgi:predicted O-linked N-acetylglucosamine transferase (SPINDLY family)